MWKKELDITIALSHQAMYGMKLNYTLIVK